MVRLHFGDRLGVRFLVRALGFVLVSVKVGFRVRYWHRVKYWYRVRVRVRVGVWVRVTFCVNVIV